mmetsp:Transcript_12261/g.30898  ORF Transcript_12261/g.30898 Transcript_12261/m.30898 type:complete len:287 (+) Transcript_12261:214-1074(+)
MLPKPPTSLGIALEARGAQLDCVFATETPRVRTHQGVAHTRLADCWLRLCTGHAALLTALLAALHVLGGTKPSVDHPQAFNIGNRRKASPGNDEPRPRRQHKATLRPRLERFALARLIRTEEAPAEPRAHTMPQDLAGACGKAKVLGEQVPLGAHDARAGLGVVAEAATAWTLRHHLVYRLSCKEEGATRTTIPIVHPFVIDEPIQISERSPNLHVVVERVCIAQVVRTDILPVAESADGVPITMLQRLRANHDDSTVPVRVLSPLLFQPPRHHYKLSEEIGAPLA